MFKGVAKRRIEVCGILHFRDKSESLRELTRNAVGTQAVGECCHSFFEFSQTFTSVSITRYKHGEHVYYFF